MKSYEDSGSAGVLVAHEINIMRKKNQKLHREIVVVHWEDSYTHSGQKAEKEWSGYGTGFCISAGILVKEDTGQITLAQDLFYDQPPTVEGDQFRNVFSIPKRCIVKVEKISAPSSMQKSKKEGVPEVSPAKARG